MKFKHIALTTVAASTLFTGVIAVQQADASVIQQNGIIQFPSWGALAFQIILLYIKIETMSTLHSFVIIKKTGGARWKYYYSDS